MMQRVPVATTPSSLAEGGKVTGHIWGDFSKGKGGNDVITIAGTVTGNVEGDRHKATSTADGGNDTIIIEESGVSARRCVW